MSSHPIHQKPGAGESRAEAGVGHLDPKGPLSFAGCAHPAGYRRLPARRSAGPPVRCFTACRPAPFRFCSSNRTISDFGHADSEGSGNERKRLDFHRTRLLDDGGGAQARGRDAVPSGHSLDRDGVLLPGGGARSARAHGVCRCCHEAAGVSVSFCVAHLLALRIYNYLYKKEKTDYEKILINTLDLITCVVLR